MHCAVTMLVLVCCDATMNPLSVADTLHCHLCRRLQVGGGGSGYDCCVAVSSCERCSRGGGGEVVMMAVWLCEAVSVVLLFGGGGGSGYDGCVAV